MDEVMADAVAEHLVRYNREFNNRLHQGRPPRQTLLADRPSTEHHESSTNTSAPKTSSKTSTSCPTHPASSPSSSPLRDLHRLRRHGSPQLLQPQVPLAQRHFPFIPHTHIVFCGDKSILRADYLIDDNPRQLEAFTGTGILYDAPHNVNLTGYTRVRNWLEIEQLFLAGK